MAKMIKAGHLNFCEVNDLSNYMEIVFSDVRHLSFKETWLLFSGAQNAWVVLQLREIELLQDALADAAGYARTARVPFEAMKCDEYHTGTDKVKDATFDYGVNALRHSEEQGGYSSCAIAKVGGSDYCLK